MADNLTIEIGADSSKLRADLAVAQAQMRAFGSELKRAANESLKSGDTTAIPTLAKNFEDARLKAAALTTTIKEHTAAHTGLRGALQASSSELRAGAEHMRAFGASVSNVGNNILPGISTVLTIGLGAALFELAKKFGEVNDEMRETINLAKALGFTTEQFEAAALSAAKFGVGGDELAKALARSARALGQLREEGLKLTGDSGQIVSGVVTLKGNMQNVADASLVARGGVHQLNESLLGTTATLRGTTAGAKETALDLKKLFLDIANDPNLSDVEKQVKVAQRIDQIKDATLKATVAAGQYGRSWYTVLPAIEGLGEGLKKAEAEIKESGLGMMEYEKTNVQAFSAARAEWEFFSNRVSEIVFGTLSTGIIPLFEGLTGILKRNGDDIRAWALEWSRYLAQVSKDILAIMHGNFGAVVTGWGRTFIALGAGALVFFSLAKSGFDLLAGAMQPVAQLMNAIFGTHISGEALVIAAILVRMTGLWGPFAEGAKLAAFAMRNIWTVMELMRAHPIIAILGVLALLALKIYENWDTIAPLFQSLWNLLTAFAGWVVDAFPKSWAEAGELIIKIVTGLVDGVLGLLGKIIDKAIDAAKALARALGAGASAAAEGAAAGAAPGFAGGGYIRGAGTSTSDSIPAYLSNGEYVVRAAAVSRIGIGSLDRINSGHVPRFAEGGLVGGTGGTAVHLHIGSREFPMSASKGVADGLVAEARNRHMLTTGRKPSWHGS